MKDIELALNKLLNIILQELENNKIEVASAERLIHEINNIRDIAKAKITKDSPYVQTDFDFYKNATSAESTGGHPLNWANYGEFQRSVDC